MAPEQTSSSSPSANQDRVQVQDQDQDQPQAQIQSLTQLARFDEGQSVFKWSVPLFGQPEQLGTFTPALFDPTYAPNQAQPVTVGGRAAAWFIQIGTRQAVLKHYRRGGLIGRWVRDQYFWAGQDRVRSFAEFEVLSQLTQWGLPVPPVMAAAYWRTHGLCYRAAIITQRIAGARPLALSNLDADWSAAGHVVRRMHQCGVWHADLNVFNILVDALHTIWLIDFDRARLAVHSPTAQQGNMDRLKRSIDKVCGAYAPVAWRALRQGYDQEAL